MRYGHPKKNMGRKCKKEVKERIITLDRIEKRRAIRIAINEVVFYVLISRFHYEIYFLLSPVDLFSAYPSQQVFTKA